MRKLIENLENKENNYLYPFFWQHGESKEVLDTYIDKMYESGIRSFCIESRHYKGYLTEDWWKSLDCIISKAKTYGMQIWILDDAKFPTGYANGQVPDNLKKRYLNMRRFDIAGPIPQAEVSLFTVADLRTIMLNPNVKDDEIVKVILAKNDLSNIDSFHEDSLKDVTNLYEDGILRLDIEAGHYSVFVLYETSIGGEESTKDYLDPTRKEATQILLDVAYEGHYERYKKEFGKTIVGFFSDEPRFGNVKGMDAILGKKDMVIPWNVEIRACFEEKHSLQDLPFLFKGESAKAKETRFSYMDIVSKLYSENFTKVLGNWCENKGIDYVGHMIEDNNAHTRLGYGTGHYFRGVAGQSIAGIDIIGGQVVPGMDYPHDASSTGGSDGEFYHYALCKLGASAAKLDPNKRGILMCEAFGAYGWVEGLKMMKWITNHMLSHGVNLIVPHAFDPAGFPDWDCPPHFYAHGNNPQFPYFSNWVDYINRLCNLLSGGYQKCEVGVLYHAFAEWSDDTMYVQTVIKELQQHQIDCNIISEDYLLGAVIKDKKYYINGYGFHTLIIPEVKKLPNNLLDKITELAKDINVIFVNDVPNGFDNNDCRIIDLFEVSEELKSYKEMYTDTKEEYLSYYHYVHNDGEVYIFNNESVMKKIETEITLNTNDELMIYDAFDNKSYKLDYTKEGNALKFELDLAPYEMLVLVTGKSNNSLLSKGKKLLSIETDIDISLKAYNQQNYEKIYEKTSLFNLGINHPRFSGNVKYECKFNTTNQNVILELIDVYEIVEVIVNGENCGVRISPNYIFDISSACNSGENTLEIIVTNNLARSIRDGFSQYLALEPMGILGKIEIYEKMKL